MTSLDHDQILFTFTDLKSLFLHNKARIIRSIVIGGLIAFTFLLLRPFHYKIESTFKQSSRQDGPVSGVKEIFRQFMPHSSESGIIAVMQSTEVMKGAVQKLGLQVRCDRDGFITELVKRARNNFVAEFGEAPPDQDKFSFSNVQYSGEKGLGMFLCLKEGGLYQLFDSKKQPLSVGKLGEALSFPGGKLTLNSYPKYAKIDKYYSLSVSPLVGTIEHLRSKLKVLPHRLDGAILQFIFLSDDRNSGADFLNELMLSYQDYLKRESDDYYQKQLHYLGKRQEELTAIYDLALIEHADYLKENLAKNGFIGFEQEIETLSEPKNLYTSKLFEIDLELKRLMDSKETFARSSLKGEQVPHQPVSEEISLVKQQLEEASLLLQCVEKGEKIPSTPSLLKEPRSAVALLVKQMTSSMQKMPGLEAESLAILRASVDQLEQKHKALEEDLKLKEQRLDEFSALSLETAQELLMDYTRQRDSLQAQMRELVFLRQQLARPGFEISSLGGVFEDGVTRDLVSRASAIALQLEDENNRSVKEQERLNETLQTQKNFLSHYIFQTVDLKRLRIKLLGDKIASLQQAACSLLQSEKELLKEKLLELNGKMEELPEKWRRESLLTLKKELGAAMLQGVSQFIETKFLAQHTTQIASKPLDIAIPPLRPKPPRILFYTLVIALFSGVLLCILIFCKTLFKGIPVSDETLRLLGLHVSGKLSKYCNTSLSEVQEKDLETLRHAASLLTSRHIGPTGLVAACICGKNSDYTRPLAELLAMRNLRSIVLQCSFDKTLHKEEIPGLWQYLQGQIPELPIRRQEKWDFVTSGGTSRHGPEILSGPAFQNLLSDLKQRYDIVLLYCSTGPAKMEGVSLLNMADVVLVSVAGENRRDLNFYGAWGEKKGEGSVSFIFSEGFC